jgi:hypothetical protein
MMMMCQIIWNANTLPHLIYLEENKQGQSIYNKKKMTIVVQFLRWIPSRKLSTQRSPSLSLSSPSSFCSNYYLWLQSIHNTHWFRLAFELVRFSAIIIVLELMRHARKKNRDASIFRLKKKELERMERTYKYFISIPLCARIPSRSLARARNAMRCELTIGSSSLLSLFYWC